MCGLCAEKTVKHVPYHPCMVYLPSDVVDLYAFHVGKHTNRHMDGVGVDEIQMHKTC